ncbi:hypothetical protein C4D60_Mb01t33270 [Musa balbisiana]|uniref:ESCRT-II complex subunit VPS25 n=1 Tax=Musa balbisiana TaxID=52838 RepID=A0A4S8JSI2_MUSBA|nr:hypothetical protein C4D60_Mb01t33270 [Musa balbisiana]
MQRLGNFKLPQFFNFPPFFTLQPVKETREKQVQVWKQLLLDYCRSQKIFVIGLEEDFPLFSNPVIENFEKYFNEKLCDGLLGSLSHEAREVFLSALISEGHAEWMDKDHRKCLMLWFRLQEWADYILNFVKDNGLQDGVMTIEEMRSGTETHGTADTLHATFSIIQELAGIDRGLLLRVLRLLEQKGKATIFKGTSADDDGVKFSV